MRQHTNDYKLSAVKYYLKSKMDMRSVCKIFDCKYQSLSRWVSKYEKQGSVNRKKRSNKNLKITPEIVAFVNDYVKKFNTTTLWEFSRLISENFHIRLNDKSIYNILKKLKITRKRLRKKYYPEKRKEQEDIDEFYIKLRRQNYQKTICLDESAIYLNMAPTYGRSKSGTRVVKKTNKYPYKKFNLLCAIKYDRVVGCILYEKTGGLKTQDILDFYNRFINGHYKNHLIIMDNAVIHRSRNIKELIEETGNILLHSVPYHPETNAIEEFFSQLKHYIKKESPGTYEDTYKVIKNTIETKIKTRNLTNYIKHSYKIYE
jgi:putative transposase